MTNGSIFLIPSFLGETNAHIIPQQTKDAVMLLNEFVVEDLRSARRFLRAIGYTKNFDTEVTLRELDKHVAQQNCKALLQSVPRGNSVGIISEAGSPCIADPGNELVAFAHSNNYEVIPLVGPSSILLALIASGMNGQQFAFSGYLPIQSNDRVRAIKRLEDVARRTGATQLFMETPFRNQRLLEYLLQTLCADTKLCIACDLTLSTQLIKTKTVLDWQSAELQLHKRYCIFAIG